MHIQRGSCPHHPLARQYSETRTSDRLRPETIKASVFFRVDIHLNGVFDTFVNGVLLVVETARVPLQEHFDGIAGTLGYFSRIDSVVQPCAERSATEIGR
jgi:hypothetical protein